MTICSACSEERPNSFFLDNFYLGFRARPLVRALFQSLVQQDEAVLFPVQALDTVPPPPAEQEQCVGKWVQLKLLLDEAHQAVYTVKRGKHLTLCKEGQKNIRFDSLKKEYTEDAIRAVISGKKQRQPREQKPIPAQQNVQKILDMAAIQAASKGYAYERWATNFNTKAASKSLLYLQTVCGGRCDVLAQKADEAAAHCHELLDQMNAAQKRLTEIDVLRRHILNYARTREVFQQYKASGYSKNS